MRLFAGCDMTLHASEPCPAVAMLRPRSGLAQWLASEKYQFDPPVRPTEFVDNYGNLCQRFEIAPGSMRIQWSAVVETDDVISVEPNALATPVGQLPDEALQFMLQSRYCPSDKMVDKAQQIAGWFVSGYSQVEAIRAWIHRNIAYQYGVSSATTDAIDTLNANAGVCRDFSHIGISLCRALHIPARMVVGYLYELNPMDLHAWFEAYIGGRWYTFDATQDRPRGGRIVVAYGRDAADVAFISNYGGLTTTSLKAWVQLDNFQPLF
jgi:transglutaminase-like putative cysteine protease